MMRSVRSLFAFLAVTFAACGGTPVTSPQTPPRGEAPANGSPAAAKAIVDAADRSAADKALDGGRHPAETLAFFDVRPGMKVAELGAGGGYTAELLARAVGSSGTVYGQNSKFILEKFAEKPWTERLTKPVMKNVIRVDREFDDPLPPEAKDLDVVFVVLFYHDTVWLEVDRAKMNLAIHRALKPGGTFAVIDHSGRSGTGTSETKTLHRIEESVVRAEIEKAGFKFTGKASFMENAGDSRDWSASPATAGERRGQSDRFVLKFTK